MLTAREVSRLAGFKKPWMLNHLEREGIFMPDQPRESRHGVHRQYTFRDLVVLRSINRMLELGARPKRIKKAISTFASKCPDQIGDMSIEGIQLKFAQSAGHFVVTADDVLFCNPKEIIDLLSGGQLAFSFMIDSNVATLPSLRAAADIVALEGLRRRNPKALERIAKNYAL